MISAVEAIKNILNKANLSAYRVSLELGHTAGYIQSIYQKRASIQTDTLQKVADVCGYKLALIKDDDVIIIDE
ncbi:helix-turn-helix domain-containing protein [Atopobium deltae]|uniref:HTH cro/C1-type domain-containing protein n=1 Tax=Atopobium deltae TaxID=1393034 RepID=A0A133XWM1_9ACTN|nr:hypothetical protein HMPREF3192_00405 [Atopobium deltae]